MEIVIGAAEAEGTADPQFECPFGEVANCCTGQGQGGGPVWADGYANCCTGQAEASAV